MNKHIEDIEKIETDRKIKFPPLYKQFLADEIKIVIPMR